MSVQKEIERISGKVTEQAALIEEIGAILDGKATTETMTVCHVSNIEPKEDDGRINDLWLMTE